MKIIELDTSYQYNISEKDGIIRISRSSNDEMVDSKVVRDDIAIIIQDKVYRLFYSMCAIGWDKNKNTIEMYLYFEDFMKTDKEQLSKELI